MKYPLVSIITPSYNQGSFIEDAVLSIKSQTYPNIEHIIIDGGSTDETLELIQKHEGTYNMRWISEADDGMYHAINKGLRMAKGDIFAYLNCDDFYFPWSVETVVRSCDNYELIFGDLIRLNFITNKVEFSFTPPFFSTYYRAIGIINQPTVFFSRKALNKVGYFDESFRNVADCEYWLRCNAAGIRPKKVCEFLAAERWYEDSLSLMNLDRLESEMARVRTKYGDWKTHLTFLYRPITYLYWRFALLLYMLKKPSMWKELKKTDLMKSGWSLYFQQILPKAIRRYENKYLQVDTFIERLRRLLQHSGSPDDSANQPTIIQPQ